MQSEAVPRRMHPGAPARLANCPGPLTPPSASAALNMEAPLPLPLVSVPGRAPLPPPGFATAKGFTMPGTGCGPDTRAKPPGCPMWLATWASRGPHGPRLPGPAPNPKPCCAASIAARLPPPPPANPDGIVPLKLPPKLPPMLLPDKCW